MTILPDPDPGGNPRRGRGILRHQRIAVAFLGLAITSVVVPIGVGICEVMSHGFD
ncbi:MAG: hypothetical protein ABR593_09530 [Candidatus Limnocylindria bacterium]